jgi:hypothetical protein
VTTTRIGLSGYSPACACAGAQVAAVAVAKSSHTAGRDPTPRIEIIDM